MNTKSDFCSSFFRYQIDFTISYVKWLTYRKKKENSFSLFQLSKCICSFQLYTMPIFSIMKPYWNWNFFLFFFFFLMNESKLIKIKSISHEKIKFIHWIFCFVFVMVVHVYYDFDFFPQLISKIIQRIIMLLLLLFGQILDKQKKNVDSNSISTHKCQRWVEIEIESFFPEYQISTKHRCLHSYSFFFVFIMITWFYVFFCFVWLLCF